MFTLSQARVDDLQSNHSNEVPRIAGLQLHNLLLDEPPSVEINHSSMGINAVSPRFDMAYTALALVESAHLASLKAFIIKSMSHLTQRLDSETGLQAPTFLEAQRADKQLWHIMEELINEKGWTLNQASHALTSVRGDMAVFLHARPRLQRSNPHPKGGKGCVPSSTPGPAATKGSGKQGPTGSAKSGKPGVQWVTEAYVDGAHKQRCVLFQTPSFTFSDCKFRHAGAIPNADGTAYGFPHATSQHDSTQHVLNSVDVKTTGVADVRNPQPSQPQMGHTTHGGDDILQPPTLQEKSFPGHSNSMKEPVEVSHAEIPSTIEPPPTSFTQALPEESLQSHPLIRYHQNMNRHIVLEAFLDICAGSTCHKFKVAHQLANISLPGG